LLKGDISVFNQSVIKFESFDIFFGERNETSISKEVLPEEEKKWCRIPDY
jgi:hypothetical protein